MSDMRKVGGGGTKRTAAVSQPRTSGGSLAAKIVAALLKDAIAAGASVVHIEPQHTGQPLVRYRIDGFLHVAKPIPADSVPSVVRRLKKLANLGGDESRVPQQGRFSVSLGDRPHGVRVNLLPVEGGQKIVLHIVEQGGEPHTLEALGFWGHTLHVLEQSAEMQRGLLVVAGPVDSGKTASLYTLLNLAIKPHVSAITIEDVIEQRQAGVTQVAVSAKPNLPYAETLRAVLNQDSNIVLVNEIREPAVADQAVHAALGGRLILAGVVARDVAAALSHLSAMRVEPYVLATALRTVVNQRLVRRLCTTCREQYTPSTKEFEALCKACGLAPDGARSHITNLQSVAAADLDVTPATLASGKLTFWRATEQGCDTCGGRGHKGQIVLAEAAVINQDMQQLIMAKAAGDALYDQAMQDGMMPLPLDGLVKAVLGLTSVEEVLRVI